MTAHHRPPPTRRLLAAARAAADRGWPVFPLRPRGKRPVLADWEDHATCDPDALARWWRAAPYNIGIACGPAGLLVIDLDAAGDHAAPPDWAGAAHGRDVLAALADRAGAENPTDTYTVATPNGEHRYFTPPHGRLRNTAGRLGWRIDTRAAGGYVVAAGSVRHTNGRRHYYTVTVSRSPAPLPAWLATALSTPPPVPLPRLPAAERVGGYIRAAVAGEARNVRAAEVGSRNHTLFVAAARLGGLVAAGALDEAAAAEALLTASSRHVGIDGFSLAEATRTIGNGLRRGQQEPRPGS